MLGYAGGFLGPLVFGICLDLAAGYSAKAWGFAFAHIAGVLLIGRLAFIWLGPRDLPGDRQSS